VTDLKSYQ